MQSEYEELVRGAGKKQDPGAPVWMMTYADTITLLTTFFILLQTFTIIDLKKLNLVMAALEGSEGAVPTNPTDWDSIIEEVVSIQIRVDSGQNEPPKWERDELSQNRDRWICRDDMGEIVITVEHVRDGLLVGVPFGRVFADMEPKVTEEGENILHSIARILNNTKNFAEIRCVAPGDLETDPIPANTACAGSVLRCFVEDHRLSPGRFAIGARGPDLMRNRKGRRRVIVDREPLVEVKMVGKEVERRSAT